MTGRFSRRDLLAGGGLATAGLVAVGGSAVAGGSAVTGPAPAFAGPHQAGIATREQASLAFATFDVTVTDLPGLSDLLGTWTGAARRLTAGLPLQTPGGLFAPPSDTGEADGLPTSRLTLTVGFGPSLFDGRFGLAARRPVALVDLPPFAGDALDPGLCGGDICIQACADDPQVAFHAVRQLARLAYGVATLRWTQTGFASGAPGGGTPRNLMGFKDGTQNPAGAELDQVVWVGDEGPDWMRGGSYQAVRRIRIALEHWDRTEVDFQEQVVGRHKYSGAPLGLKDEQEALGLDRLDSDGNPVVPENAHVRLGAAETNGGARILRRGYSYNDGTNMTAERWPPWRQGLEYDAGLLFVAYQRDLKAGFIRIFEGMARFDAMNQFTTHTGGAFFACPGGAAPGGFIGQGLFGA